MLTHGLLFAMLPMQEPVAAEGFVMEAIATQGDLVGPIALALDAEHGNPLVAAGSAGAQGSSLQALAPDAEQPAITRMDVGPVRGLLDSTVALGGGRLTFVVQGDHGPELKVLASGLPLDAVGPVRALDGGYCISTDEAVWRVDGLDGSVRRIAGGFRSLSGLVVTEDGALVAQDARGLVQVLPGVEGGVPIAGGERSGVGATDAVLLSGGVWPEPYGDALYWACPEAGEVQRVELLARGAGYALGGIEVIVRGDPATFRPAAIAAAPAGDRLIVAAYTDGNAMRLWTVTRADARRRAQPGGLADGRMNVRIAAQGPWDGSLALATLDRLEEGLVREARPFDAARARVPGARERLFGSFDSARTRRHAVWSIATFATERDDDVRRRAGILLERSLAHEAPDVREHAALALAHWPDELIQPDRIVGLLRDGAGAVCRAAAYAVTVRGYRLAGRDLVAAFDRGGDPALLAALRAAMIELRTWDAIAERIGRLTSDAERRKTLWTLFEGVRDEDAVHAVAQVASQRQVNFRIRREALEVLASFWQPSAEGAQPWPGNARIRRALERGLADEAPVVREQATAGLAQIDA